MSKILSEIKSEDLFNGRVAPESSKEKSPQSGQFLGKTGRSFLLPIFTSKDIPTSE